MHWMFCPVCGKHWVVDIGLGGWIETHMACNSYLLFCNVEQHDLFTIDAHEFDYLPQTWPLREITSPSSSSVAEVRARVMRRVRRSRRR